MYWVCLSVCSAIGGQLPLVYAAPAVLQVGHGIGWRMAYRVVARLALVGGGAQCWCTVLASKTFAAKHMCMCSRHGQQACQQRSVPQPLAKPWFPAVQQGTVHLAAVQQACCSGVPFLAHRGVKVQLYLHVLAVTVRYCTSLLFRWFSARFACAAAQPLWQVSQVAMGVVLLLLPYHLWRCWQAWEHAQERGECQTL